ncbi:MAG: hypothetical protein ACRD12_02815 [Acidimicrobiales bacterium]
MSFSNQGVDTFDERKSYVGVRLQQGVPLLDRDWNELDDIRRFAERTLRRHFIGEGVPDLNGFKVSAPTFPAPDDVVMARGRCMVSGFDVWNPEDTMLFSEQGDRVTLPAMAAGTADVVTLYLEPDVVRVDSSTDPDLANRQDVNIETCVRDQLQWSVKAVRPPDVPPLGTYVLAEISRPAGTRQITDAMIRDRRRLLLNLAETVDRVGRAETRVAALEVAMQRAQLEIEAIKNDLGRLFWDVSVDASTDAALFGGKSTITVTVHDRLGSPVPGAMLSFTADWGSLSPSFASTDARGQASVDLVGVQTDAPLRPADVGLLQRASQKVQAAVLPAPGAVEYARLRFEPEEMSVLSRYSGGTILADIGTDLPTRPIVAKPDPRTATVTVHAKEGRGAIVRGVGSVQVRFGLWVRDFVRTKIADVTRQVEVGARIGDILRQGITAEQTFDHDRVATQLLPSTLQGIQDDTHEAIRRLVFADPDIDDDHVSGTGVLSQVIAQESTAAVGARTNQAISHQLKQFVSSPTVPLDAPGGKTASTAILQRSSQITAGFAQNQRQRYSGALVGR